MENLKIQEIVEAVGGIKENIDNNVIISGVSTDTRKIKKGDLFIALKGNNFNGNDFVDKAFGNGAAAAIVSELKNTKYPVIKVDDTLSALKHLSKNYKKRFNIPTIAVTGSVGKTSTKEMIASVLNEKYCVHKTQQNFNNEIGLPLTLLELNRHHEISVLEMGMNNPGEIQRLVEIARPCIGIITNIGTAHIENLGSRENILKAKLEITTYFNEDNVLVLNCDDEYLSTVKDARYNIIGISIKGNGIYNARDIRNLGEEGVEFKSTYRGMEYIFRISVPGVHNVYNALAAIAVADIYDLDAEQIKRGIFNFNPGKLRMDIINLNSGIKIINDCYNANPESMKAALDVLGSCGKSRKIAVLGDMFELGNFSEEGHRQVGRYLIDKCDILIAVGKSSIFTFEEAKNKVRSLYFESKEEAFQYISEILVRNDVLLIKASRGMNMEQITNSLVGGIGLAEDRKGN